jgi:hypothetical protein
MISKILNLCERNSAVMETTEQAETRKMILVVYSGRRPEKNDSMRDSVTIATTRTTKDDHRDDIVDLICKEDHLEVSFIRNFFLLVCFGLFSYLI